MLDDFVGHNLAIYELHLEGFVLPPWAFEDVAQSFRLRIGGDVLWVSEESDNLLLRHADRDLAWVSGLDVAARCSAP